MTEVDALDADIERLRRDARRLRGRLEDRFLGQRDTIELLILAVLGGGHVLLEGAPGLGKTTLVHLLADAVDLGFRRIQCTPDLMPTDVLGTRVLHESEGGAREFRFEPGPVFTNVLLVDEINRATPRTQSALLEAMQERQITVHGETRRLEEPFVVVATQNPIEMEGTYPLPEAQLDRFLFELEIEMPEAGELARILGSTTGAPPSDEGPCLGADDVLAMRRIVRDVHPNEDVLDFAARLVLATHPDHPTAPESVRRYVRYGSSPRGGQAVLLGGKARALLDGRLHVSADDVAALAAPALRHRVLINYEGEAAGARPDDLVADALEAARAARSSR